MAAPAITTKEWAERLSGTFLAELDAEELRGEGRVDLTP